MFSFVPSKCSISLFCIRTDQVAGMFVRRYGRVAWREDKARRRRLWCARAGLGHSSVGDDGGSDARVQTPTKI